jgi:hypothetical protein
MESKLRRSSTFFITWYQPVDEILGRSSALTEDLVDGEVRLATDNSRVPSDGNRIRNYCNLTPQNIVYCLRVLRVSLT